MALNFEILEGKIKTIPNFMGTNYNLVFISFGNYRIVLVNLPDYSLLLAATTADIF
jgi:hypothetical protein